MVTDRYANADAGSGARSYFPAVIRSEHDSAFDALVALDVPRDEAMDLTVADWGRRGPATILAAADGGRAVAVVPLADGRWAACNAYPEHACATPVDAERRLAKVLKRGRRGLVAEICLARKN